MHNQGAPCHSLPCNDRKDGPAQKLTHCSYYSSLGQQARSEIQQVFG